MIDTRGYMTAAYVVASVIYIAYSVSLWLRAKKYNDLRKDGGPSTRSARSE
jgi:hypothetical protein